MNELSIIVDWVIGGIAASILWAALLKMISAYNSKSQKRILTTVAAANGLAIILGFSPLATLATELVPLTPLLTVNFPNLIYAIVDVATGFTLLFGSAGMLEQSGWLGVVAFGIALFGGALLLISPMLGFLLIGFSYTVEELAPSNSW